MDLADRVFDAVLAMDPSNASALTWKAAICFQRDQWDDGNSWINRAYSIRRDLPELLELLSRVLNVQAIMNTRQAEDLRSTKSWTDFGPIYDTVWTHEPSQEELAQANGLEANANQMWQNAHADLEKAAQAAGNTADGYYYGGLLQYREGNLNTAIVDLLLAYKMDLSRRNTDALVGLLFKTQRLDDAVNARFKFALTRETTATPLLNSAFVNIQRRAFDKAQVFVNDAIPIDPCDTRIDAYAASIATAANNPQEALHWYNIALALEEASANLDGDSLWRGNGQVSAQQAGLTLMLDLRAAARAAQLGKHDEQMAYLDRNARLEPRVFAAQWTAPDYRTLLPNPNEPDLKLPKNAECLFAWTHVMRAQGLVAEQRFDQAAAECQMVWNSPHEPFLYAAQQRAIALLERVRMMKEDAAMRQQWQANAATLNPLSAAEIDRISQVKPLSQGDLYPLRRYAAHSTFSLGDADQGSIDDAPGAAAAPAANADPQPAPPQRR
jgi:tetratricopeptide (TPR) repeat protein